MKKHKLIIASVLKPVNGTRMYEKFGLSLGQKKKYDINIIGFYVKNVPPADNITFHPLFKFRRLRLARLLAPWICFKKYVELKPELIIINTHELLIVTILYKIIFGARIVYDIQENYFRNLLHTNSFPKPVRPILACYIRAKEYISWLFVDHYFLAEASYENEFSFSRGKSTVLQNKYQPPVLISPAHTPSRLPAEIRLVFTGTLAESTGIFEAVKIAVQLHQMDPAIRLYIVGYCAMESTYHQLMQAIENRSFIHLKGGRELVSHEEILHAIQEADFGIIYYPFNKSTVNTMPTKLYEYLGNSLPVLIRNHQPWVELCNHYNACIIVNPDQLDTANVLKEMKIRMNKIFEPKMDIFWRSEEEKLLDKIAEIL